MLKIGFIIRNKKGKLVLTLIRFSSLNLDLMLFCLLSFVYFYFAQQTANPHKPNRVKPSVHAWNHHYTWRLLQKTWPECERRRSINILRNCCVTKHSSRSWGLRNSYITGNQNSRYRVLQYLKPPDRLYLVSRKTLFYSNFNPWTLNK